MDQWVKEVLEETNCPNENVYNFRLMLSQSPHEGEILPDDTLICSSYRPDGRYSTEYMKAGIEQIAAAICANDYDKLFCNSDDYAVFCTEGKRLDSYVSGVDEKFIAELMKAVEKAGQKR